MLRMCSTVLLDIGPRNFLREKLVEEKFCQRRSFDEDRYPTILKRKFNRLASPGSFSFKCHLHVFIFLQMYIPKLFSITNKLRSLRGGSQKRCGIELLKPRIADRLETCELRTRVKACLRHSRGGFNDLEELAVVFAGYRADVRDSERQGL